MATDATSPPHPLLPSPFNTSTAPFTLIAQGAESLLFRTTFLSPTRPAALKIRPEKKWRHPTLDKRLTRGRILAEARVLVKLSGEGIAAGSGGRKVKDPKREGKGNEGVGSLRGAVPAVLGLDWEKGWLVTEWVKGRTVKQAIYDSKARRESAESDAAVEELKALLRRVGEVVGTMHWAGVAHGDLTTSNMMLRPPAGVVAVEKEEALEGDVVLIDFGLATQTVSEEDRAVDLYVLERAFGSTHPKEEHLFEEVLKAYAEAQGSGMKGKPGKAVLRKLEDVRMRGRKKSMIG